MKRKFRKNDRVRLVRDGRKLYQTGTIVLGFNDKNGPCYVVNMDVQYVSPVHGTIPINRAVFHQDYLAKVPRHCHTEMDLMMSDLNERMVHEVAEVMTKTPSPFAEILKGGKFPSIRGIA